MNKKIVLIQPKNTLALNTYPPLSLIKIGSALKASGYTVRIVNSPVESGHIRVVLEECRDAMMAGIGVLTSEMPDAISTARAIKERYNIPVIWGGWHATLFPEQTGKSRLADKVVVGEGDESIVKIAEFYKKGGRGFNDGRILFKNEKRLDLDTLPEPDYSLIPGIEYYINRPLADKFMEYDRRAIRWLPYEASRGCPCDCAFCVNSVTENQLLKKKSPQKVVHEIESMVKKHNINHLKIVDDNFFVDVKWAKEIAAGLADKDLGITWDAECRVDYFNKRHVNRECLRLCAESGLNELNFGIESGSQKSLDIMNKKITPRQALNAVKAASDNGIVSRCSFVIDVPGEEPADIYKTVKLINEIRKIPKTTCGVHTYRPYPGSRLCEALLRNGTIEQPKDLEGWTDRGFVEQFTYAEAKRKWQKNHNLSSRVSFYESLESGFWIRPHQVRNGFIRFVNSVFMGLARARNRHVFYGFSVDRYLYLFFKNLYYKFQPKR